MDTPLQNSLDQKINDMFANETGYFYNMAYDLVRQYTVQMFNTKLNYFLTEFVKSNLVKMMDDIWEQEFDKQYISKMLHEEMEGKFMEKIDNDAMFMFKQFLQKEMQNKAKRIAKTMEIKLSDNPI